MHANIPVDDHPSMGHTGADHFDLLQVTFQFNFAIGGSFNRKEITQGGLLIAVVDRQRLDLSYG